MKRQRYVGDSKGTVYEIVKGDSAGAPWTLVVCEDRPGLYTRLLADVVTSGLVGTAMTVPFTTKVVELLTKGQTKVLDALLSVENLDQCILVLDMDATYAVTDLLPKKDCAFVGGELFHRLDTRLRERTYLVSLKAPLDPEYYERYPELTRIHVHPSLEEKKEDAADGGGSTLAEGTANLIRKFILQTKGELDHPTFAPVAEMRKVHEVYEVGRGDKLKRKRRVKKDAQGKAVEERCITKVTVSYDGSKPVDLKAMPGAHYLHMMLQYPGHVLDTARMVAVRNPGVIDEREDQIDRAYDEDGQSESELPSAGGHTHITSIPDDDAITSCCRDLTVKVALLIEKLTDELEAKATDEEDESRRTNLKKLTERMAAAKNGKAKGAEILSLLQEFDSEAAKVMKYIQSADYELHAKMSEGAWFISASPSLRRGGRSSGERMRPSSSGSVRKAIDRFLDQEIEHRLPRLHEHIRGALSLTDDSPSCSYNGKIPWSFGSTTDWLVSLDRISHGPKQ